MWFCVMARLTLSQMHRQMSVVDCSCTCQHEFSASGGTYVVSGLRLPKADVLRCKSDDVSCFVDDTRSCTSSTNIDANVVVLFRVDLVPDIIGAFSVWVVIASGGTPMYRRHIEGSKQMCKPETRDLNAQS